MRKKFLTGILPFILLLSACSSVKGEEPQVSRPEDLVESFGSAGDETVQDENKDSGASSDVLDSAAEGDKMQEPEATVQPDGGVETPMPAAEEGNHTYKEIYAQVVTEDTGSATVFSLIYLDNDDIPEMVVHDRGDDSYSIYTIKDDAIFCMMDSKMATELSYFERSGILCEFARWNGGGDEGGYGQYYYQAVKDGTLTDATTPILNYSYNAVYNEENIYTGEGITNYYYMGQETDEATYKEMQSSLGITSDGSRLCSENAVGKEEMLAALSR
ncbi:MAG: hypothetical protein HDQ99_12600 [Lachnospiraceae bacterium]|nr:hypothetical protein [Lachnospiraceae bacterium]